MNTQPYALVVPQSFSSSWLSRLLFYGALGAVEVFVAELVPGCQTMFLRNNKIQQVWRALRNSCGIVVQRLPNVSKCGAACVN